MIDTRPFKTRRDARPTDDEEPPGAASGSSSEATATPGERGVTNRSNREAEALSADVRFDLLQNDRRRAVLRYLRAREEAVSIGELAEHVAAAENDTSVEALSADQRKRVYVGLYQAHLPKLHDARVVRFDKEQGTVSLGPAAAELYPYIPTLQTGQERPWARYHLAGAVACGAVIALVVLGGFLSALPATVLAAAVVLWFGGFAVAHTLDSRR